MVEPFAEWHQRNARAAAKLAGRLQVLDGVGNVEHDLVPRSCVVIVTRLHPKEAERADVSRTFDRWRGYICRQIEIHIVRGGARVHLNLDPAEHEIVVSVDLHRESEGGRLRRGDQRRSWRGQRDGARVLRRA